MRKRRTRSEAKIISKVSLVIDVPKIKKVSETKIEMDFISGKRLSDYLDEMSEKKALNVCKIIGRNVAALHDIDIIHGDLTTSNMIFKDKNKKENKVYFIDFGLSFHSHRIEDKAVDLHLLRQALESKHFKKWNKYFKAVISGYRKSKNYASVLKQLEKVEMRGRYKRKDKKRKEKKD